MTWIRRTRLADDLWDMADVPLGEEAELYLVRVLNGTETVREETVSSAVWTYSAAMQAEDGFSGDGIEVAQVSAIYGPGPAVRMAI